MIIAKVCFPTPGGSGVVATELGKELARRGHEIHFVSYRLPFRLERENREKHFHYHQVDLNIYPLFPHPFLTIELAAKLLELQNRYPLQVIHVHYALPNTISALLAREVTGKGVKVITTVHGTDITVWGREPALKPLLRYGLEKSDAVTAVSLSLRDDTLEILEVEKEIHVLYNFIHTGIYRRLPSSRLRSELAPRGEKIILHVSNFRPVKRIPDLLRAFALLSAAKKDVILVLAGEGVDKERAAAMTVELGLAHKVRFLEPRANLVPLYSAADLFVLPSEKESFGLAALEAMACSLPVVASNTGGLPEIVDNGKTGFLLPVGDVAALAEAMERLLADNSLYQQFAAASRRKAELFSTERIIPQYEKLYRRVLAKD